MSRYVDKAELLAEFKKSKAANWQWTERFGELLLDMHHAALRCRSFRNYNEDMKQDMQSYSLMQLMKSMKKYRSSKGDLFPYLYMAIYWNFVAYCKKHYTQLNRQRHIVVHAL